MSIKNINTSPNLTFSYKDKISLEEFNNLEQQQRVLINADFSSRTYYLFTKYVSIRASAYFYDPMLCLHLLSNI